MAIGVLGWCSSAMLLLSCAKPTKSFTPDRFVHDEYAYAVHYLSQGPENLLGADWRLDNYVWNKGVPKKQKQECEYVVHREYDMNDDGEVDTKADEPYYDLLPRAPSQGRHHLGPQRADLESRPDERAGRVRGATRRSRERLRQRPRAVRCGRAHRLGEQALRVSGSQPGRVQRFGCPGSIVSTSKWRHVDQLQLTPNARWIRSRIVLVQTLFAHVPNRRVPKKTLPIVMVAGPPRCPEDFERLAADFDPHAGSIGSRTSRARLTMSTSCAAHVCVAGAEAREPSAPAAESVAPSGQPAEGCKFGSAGSLDSTSDLGGARSGDRRIGSPGEQPASARENHESWRQREELRVRIPRGGAHACPIRGLARAEVSPLARPFAARVEFGRAARDHERLLDRLVIGAPSRLPGPSSRPQCSPWRSEVRSR